MGALREHLHIGLVLGVYLRALQNLQAHRAVLVVGEERAAARLAHILHHAAHAHGTVQLAAQVVGVHLVVLRLAAQLLLHKGSYLLQLSLGGTLVEQLQIAEGLLLQADQHAGYHLLPFHGLRLQAVGHHVVDVLDEDHIGGNLVQVLDQRTVTARTEQHRAIGLAEGRAVGIGGDGVGRRFLLREADVVLHAVFLCEAVGLLGHLLLEEFHVLMAHREVHVSLALRGGVEGALHQMLLHRRARAFGIFVEQQHALR